MFLLVIAILMLSAEISTANQQVRQDADIMIYNSNFGVVTESINADFKEGLQTFTITDLPIVINPESIKLELDGKILESSFNYEPFDVHTLLIELQNKRITLTLENGDKITGTLFDANQSEILIRDENGKFHIIPREGVTISPESIPDYLNNIPTMNWLLAPNKPGKQKLSLNYQCNEMYWNAQYFLILADDEKSASIEAWFNVINRTGVAFNNADISLFAGKVMRIQKSQNYQKIQPNVRMNMQGDGIDYGGFAANINFDVSNEEIDFLDYYLFKIPHKVTLNNYETKKINFFKSDKIKTNKKYISSINDSYSFAKEPEVFVQFEFQNTKKNNLGRILPKGLISVYKKDKAKDVFLGENNLRDLKVNSLGKVVIGNAFDVAIKRNMDEIIYTDSFKNEVATYSFSMELDNSNRKEDSEFEIIYKVNEKQDINYCSHQYERINISSIKIQATAKAGKKETIKIKVNNLKQNKN